ncbi:hypothetical protein BDV28DRAFT_144565 [Aspergillus coremiiformis]|uniref:Uncharacterized protein n=1 Tax=Aspergillus coremiiformis TaxID=138285 RepID=A0A5N6YRC8_9EURO|nr:hypothetical protein BDV28DRAFT_144565 [Aspergillus coremiiformis]
MLPFIFYSLFLFSLFFSFGILLHRQHHRQTYFVDSLCFGDLQVAMERSIHCL